MNKVVGLGFTGPPSAAELGEIEQAYRAVDAPVQVELANLADPAIADMLTGRGYRLVSFENVLGMPLTTAYVAPVVTGGRGPAERGRGLRHLDRRHRRCLRSS